MPVHATLSCCNRSEYCQCTVFLTASSHSSSDRVAVFRLGILVFKGLRRETDHSRQPLPPLFPETIPLLPPHCEFRISTDSQPFPQFLISPQEGSRHCESFILLKRTAVAEPPFLEVQAVTCEGAARDTPGAILLARPDRRADLPGLGDLLSPSTETQTTVLPSVVKSPDSVERISLPDPATAGRSPASRGAEGSRKSTPPQPGCGHCRGSPTPYRPAPGSVLRRDPMARSKPSPATRNGTVRPSAGAPPCCHAPLDLRSAGRTADPACAPSFSRQSGAASRTTCCWRSGSRSDAAKTQFEPDHTGNARKTSRAQAVELDQRHRQPETLPERSNPLWQTRRPARLKAPEDIGQLDACETQLPTRR